MKRVLLTAATLSLIFGPSLVGAADQDAATQPSPTASPTANAPMGAPAANAPTGSPQASAQTPPENWTSLKGTVQAIDTTAKTLQIKDETGNLVQVPVDRQVSIQKEDGKSVKLSQVQTGDIIILAKKPGSSTPTAY